MILDELLLRCVGELFGNAREDRAGFGIDSPAAHQPGLHGLGAKVDIDIYEGWHAYDEALTETSYIPLKLDLKLPKGLKQGDWVKPEATLSIDDPNVLIFEGRLTFACELIGKSRVSRPPSSKLTLARPNSKHTHRTTIPRTNLKTRRLPKRIVLVS